MDAVLGTMGISQEELDRQRKKAKLAEQLMVMADDPKGLEMMLKGQDAQLDYEFFAILSDMLARAQAAGDEKATKQLTALRERLMEVTSWGKRAKKQEAAVASLKDLKSPDEFLDRILVADGDEVEAIAVAARPVMDYAFFQKLTDRIESSQGTERDRLTKLRERLLEITRQMDDAMKATMQDAGALLQELLSSPNVRTSVREHADEINDTFLAVLSANMQEAERRGSKAALERMATIYDEIMGMLQEEMPPEVQLVNELLSAPYPDGTRELLKQHQVELTPEVLEIMDRLADQMSQRDDPGSVETAKRLSDIKAQAALLV